MARRTVARATDRFAEKREAIVTASTAILNRAGVKGLTLADAAAAVGLSTTSVTYYFKRKDDLAAACLMRAVRWYEGLAEQMMAEPTAERRLARLIELYLERTRQIAVGQSGPLAVLSDIRALNQPQRHDVVHAYMKVFRAMRGLFDAPETEWLSRGRKTARTHMLLEQIYWAAAWLPKYDPDDYPRIRDRMLDVLLHGLAVPGHDWSPKPLADPDLAAGAAHEPAKEAFLKAATRLINKKGYRGASVDEISAELNVTKGSFYHHNEAKDDLVVACFERTYDAMRRVQRLSGALDDNHWIKLSSAAAALTEYQVSEHGPLLRTSALSALPEGMRQQMVARSDRVSDHFASMISDGVAEGCVRPVDPAIAAQMLNATLNAAAELGFWVPGVAPRAAASVFARPMLMGIFSR